MKLQGFLKSFIFVLFATQTSETPTSSKIKCKGAANLDALLIHYNKQFIPTFVRFFIKATIAESSHSSNPVTISASTDSTLLQVTREDDRHDRTGGRYTFLSTGLNSVEKLSIDGENLSWKTSWKTIPLYCQPAGVIERSPYEIIGYCELNTTRKPLCVQFFRLQLNKNGEWSDVSTPGLCSDILSTTNLSNSVILEYDGQYGFETVLYFGERGTNILQEVHLGKQEAYSYTIPSYQGLVMSIDRIVLTRSGVRIESTNSNTPNVVYHIQFSLVKGRFVGPVTRTETIAFDPFNYAFLVSFTLNLDKMVISSNGTVRQYKLVSAIDSPIQCLNMAGPDHHYLVCLAGNGLRPILINVNTGISQTLLVSNSPVYSFGVLDKVSFYFLNIQQELLLYEINSSSVLPVGTFTIPPGVNLRPIHYNRGTLNCSDHITADNNQTNNDNNQTDNDQTDNDNDQTENGNDQTDNDNDQTDNDNDQTDNDNDQTDNDYDQIDVSNQGNQNDSQTNNSYQGDNQTSNNNQSGSNNQINSSGQVNQNNHINVTDQDHSNNQSNNNNNQINISNQTNSNVFAIVIVAIFIIVCGAIIMYGLKRWRSSRRQKLETQSNERILESRVKRDSPKCQRPQIDTGPHNGTMIVRQAPPKAIKKYSFLTNSEEEITVMV